MNYKYFFLLKQNFYSKIEKRENIKIFVSSKKKDVFNDSYNSEEIIIIFLCNLMLLM